MCELCVKEEEPDRGDFCLESGAYLVNFVSCHACGRKEPLQEVEKLDTVEDDTQLVSFKHACSSCSHVVACHSYTFFIEDGFQNYTMSCLLCGAAEDERSCLPDDPRK